MNEPLEIITGEAPICTDDVCLPAIPESHLSSALVDLSEDEAAHLNDNGA